MIEKSIFKDGANKNLTHPKEEKGITLIALIITIIVLLILAGVSILTITGENGILERARSAEEKSSEAQETENTRLTGYEDVIDEATGKKKYYNVILNSNNKTNQTITIKAIIDETTKLPKCDFTLEGCEFVGWATAEKGSVVYSDMQEINNLANQGETITLYARYKHTHSDSCYTTSLLQIKCTSEFGNSYRYSLYNIYEDEECTKLVASDYKLAVKGGGADKFPIKIIDSSSNTYYTNGTNDGSSTKTNLWAYQCSNCKMILAHSSSSNKFYHYCSKATCGFSSGLQ